MAILETLFVVFCICFSGTRAQDTAHAHAHGKNDSELFHIEVIDSTNQVTKTWDIRPTSLNRKSAIRTIVKAINLYYDNNLSGTPATMTGTGYLGLKIEHFINGQSVHTGSLPKCTKPVLGKAIIQYTAGNAMTKVEKDAAYDAINACQ